MLEEGKILHFRPPPFPSPLLLMIHHEETGLNANYNLNPNTKGVRKCNSAGDGKPTKVFWIFSVNI